MTERWQTELERIDRAHPDDDLVERARHRAWTPSPQAGPGQRAGAIVVAGVLTAGLAVGGYLVLSERERVTLPGGSPGIAENGDLLFAANRGNGWRLYAADPGTGEARQLTEGVRDYGSDWSPDGTRIVYDSETAGGSEIVIADADGSNQVSIAEGESPSWSPDGTRIAYVAEGKIWVVNCVAPLARAHMCDVSRASASASVVHCRFL